MQDTLFRSRRETRGKRLGCGEEDSRDVIPGGGPRRSRCTNSIHDASVFAVTVSASDMLRIHRKGTVLSGTIGFIRVVGDTLK